MIRAIPLIALLTLPTITQAQITVIVDGNPVGTLALAEYDLAAGVVHITTDEIVFDCTPGTVNDASVITVILDGEPLGTMSAEGIEYDLAGQTLNVPIEGDVTGCRQDRIFRDRFEQQ